MATPCKVHKPVVHVRPEQHKLIFSLKSIRLAISEKNVVTMDGQTGRIVSIRQEDASGHKWLVRWAKPKTFSFWRFSFTIWVSEKQERFIYAH
jgi:hypothetical protein